VQVNKLHELLQTGLLSLRYAQRRERFPKADNPGLDGKADRLATGPSPSAACRRRHSTNCDGKRIARAADLLACAVATADCVPRMRMEFLIALCIACGEPFASAQAATIDVTVDLDADRRPLQPGIFGVSGSPDPERLAYPRLRWGDNSTTRYNWQADVHNTASDWFYMNIPDGNGTPSSSSLEAQLASTLAAGSQPLLTLSTIGWM